MGTRLRRASLQRGLEGLLAPQFNITDKQKRRSGASPLGLLFIAGALRRLSARARIITATRTKEILRNARLETCMGLEVLQQEGVGCGRSADRLFREGAIADIILYACGLWERSQSGGVKGGGT